MLSNLWARLTGVFLLLGLGQRSALDRDRKAEVAARGENFRVLAENIHDGILVNVDGRHVFANSAMAEMLGYAGAGELLGMTMEQIVHPEALAFVRDRFRRRFAGAPVPRRYETVFIGKDGAPVPVEIHASLTTWQGQPADLVSVCDMRVRQHAEKMAARFGRILDNSSNEIYLLDAATLRFVLVNEGARRNLGYSMEELAELTPLDIKPGHTRETFEALIAPLRSGELDVQTFETVHRRKDGSLYPVEVRLQLSRGETPPVFVAVILDITERRRAEQELRESERKQTALMGNLPGMVYRCRNDPDRTMEFASSGCVGLTGYPPEDLMQQRINYAQLIHADDRERVWDEVQAALRGNRSFHLTYRIQARDGAEKWAWEQGGGVYAPTGELLALEGFITDITAAYRADAQMRKLSGALAQSADGVMITDRQGVIEYVNPAFESATGYAREEALGQTPRLLRSGRQGAAFYQQLWKTILAGETFRDVFINRRKDGSLYYEEKTITPLKDEAGRITHFISTGKDVTERMHTQERLQHMAQHDALTDLPNRALFLDRLKQAMARARWHQRLVAVLFVDMDRFKTINDTLGHEAGDRLLQQLAERFSRNMHEGDTVARFGGDEFVILLDDVSSENDVGGVAQKVQQALAAPFEIDGQKLYITASIGVSLFPNDGEDSTTLLKNADIAMYRAKEAGKNTCQFYSADMSARAFERLTLESNLRHALERGEFRVYYQPQVDVDSGAIVGMEALLRWQHPDFGLVLPSDFIPLLEETGLIVPAGEWVLRTACEQLAAWRAAGWRKLRMAVNLSPRQFQSPGLLAAVKHVLEAFDGEAGCLELEITEGVLARHIPATIEMLETLHALGVHLAIDDFGTGYSSLAYLRRFPIDTLKIDRSFVRDIPGDADDSTITVAVLALAQSLKLEAIAEGVENAEQRDFLRARGCRFMQGYLFGKPLPAGDITRLLTAQAAS